MAKFLVVYRGGDPGDGEMDESVMDAWMGWFGSLGSAVTDMGNPFMGGTAIGPDGARSEETAGLSGYSLIEAGSLDDAAKAVAGCPHLASGGSVEVYEAVPM
ncbi:MAG: hypothetical protein ACHQFZ_11390 [Acidimicrobiales bacterium]